MMGYSSKSFVDVYGAPLAITGITFIIALVAFNRLIPDVYLYSEYRSVVNAFTRYPLALGISYLLLTFYFAAWERRYAPHQHQAIALLLVATVWMFVSLRLTTTVLARQPIINLQPIQSANHDLSVQVLIACIVWTVLNINLTRIAFIKPSPPLIIATFISWFGLALPVLGLITYSIISFLSGGT